VKPVKRVIYETPEQFEALIKQREVVAELLPLGPTRQSVLKKSPSCGRTLRCSGCSLYPIDVL
jgi:hypothetical protein